MNRGSDQEFFKCLSKGDIEKAKAISSTKKIILANALHTLSPELLKRSIVLFEKQIDVNAPSDDYARSPPLIWAISNKSIETIKILMKHPDINVNVTYDNMSALTLACILRHQDIIEMLVDNCCYPNLRENQFPLSPLMILSLRGDLNSIKTLLLSKEKVFFGANPKTMSLAYKLKDELPLEIKEMFKKYKGNPDLMKQRLSLELKRNVDLFSCCILLSDGYLRLNNEKPEISKPKRFLKITSKLPVELKMLICNKVYGSTKEIIHSQDIEVSLRKTLFRMI